MSNASHAAKPRFTIFGAGLAGALLAVCLARRGFAVHLFERRADPRRAGAERGRSINLALSTRGIEALRAVGLEAPVLAEGVPMRGRMIHARDGALAFQPYSADPNRAIHSVSRALLNITLLNAAEREPGVNITFGARCTGVDFDSRTAQAVDVQTGRELRVPFEVVIGADGAFSGVRSSMQKRDRFQYQQDYLAHGYKELTIEPDARGGHRIEKHALHIWPRGSFMMIALPNADGTFTCTLFWPFEGEYGADAAWTPAGVRTFFEREFADAVPLIPDLSEQFIRNPTSSLVTVRCAPWSVGGVATLVGDAAHAVVPFYGQGMNASFEDCTALAQCIAHDPGDLRSAFAEYERQRKRHTDALSRLAVENFIEMRDKTADPAFLRHKAVERELSLRHPGRYVPLYDMVTFSTLGYADAVERAAAQDREYAREAAEIERGLAGAASAARADDGRDARPTSSASDDAPDARSTGSAGLAAALIDISPMIDDQLAVWPGDEPPRREVKCRIEDGAVVTLSALHATVHTGSHADGPNHYGAGAPSIDEMPLEWYAGLCRVVAVEPARGTRVTVHQLNAALLRTGISESAPLPLRLLIRTGTYPDRTRFNTDFAGLTPELVEQCFQRGVRLIGVDAPSVDLSDSKDLPAHKAFLKRGMAILEGLVLTGVEEGEWELIALPLKLKGFDASPVRAVLRRPLQDGL